MKATIEFNIAQHKLIEQENKDRLRKEAALEEIKTTNIQGLDACDINLFAVEAGITPNEVRRLMLKPDDLDEAFQAELYSFENDETDNIFDYY